MFASNAQLELLQSATQIYFDATFKVMPTIYYQLFTVFVPFADSAFQVFYAVMSRKTNARYTKAFEKVKESVFSPFILGTTFSTPAISVAPSTGVHCTPPPPLLLLLRLQVRRPSTAVTGNSISSRASHSLTRQRYQITISSRSDVWRMMCVAVVVVGCR